MAPDDRNTSESQPTVPSAESKPIVRRRTEEGASRRPSAASIANRPSAAGKRRSRRRPARTTATVGGAAAEVETSKGRELESKAKVARSEDRTTAPVARPDVEIPKAPEGASAASDDEGRPRGGDGPSGPSRGPSEDAATARAGRRGGEEARARAVAPKDAAVDVPPAQVGEARPVSQAETASARARNVKYSSVHPESGWRRRDESREAWERRTRRRAGAGAHEGRAADPGRVPDPATTRSRVPTVEALRRKREQLRPADWHTDDDNPYLQDGVEGPQDEYWYEDEKVSPVVPVRDISPKGRRRTASATRNRALVVVLGVFAAMAALTLFVWITRSVTFTLNGADVSTTYGTTLADYIRQNELSFNPGNLVSVGGNVLAEGAGDAFAATVNGEAKRPGDAGDIHITGGEVIELGDGLDATEDYDRKVVKALPKLEFDGTIGAVSYVSQWGVPGTQEQLTGLLSGEVALGDYIEPPTNTVVTTLSIVPGDDRKLVALTFDDGPSSYTPQYLDILAQYNAKATFFMFGPSAERDPEMVKRVIEAGHQVCNHTSVHQDLSALDAEQLQNELRTTFEQVDNAAGRQTTVFRPPWSIWNHDCWLKSGGYASASVIYTADSRDWDSPGVNSIVNYALEGIAPGSIILMHDGGYSLSQDLDALPRIIGWLQENGFELVTLSELLASDPAISEIAASCDDPMPENSAWPTEFAETDDAAQ